MAVALISRVCRERIRQDSRLLESMHVWTSGKTWNPGGTGVYAGIRNRGCGMSRTVVPVRNFAKDTRGPRFCTDAFRRFGLTNVSKHKEVCSSKYKPEMLLFRSSKAARQALEEFQQIFRSTGKSLLAVRADVISQKQGVWQFLAQRSCYYKGERVTFFNLERILKAASLTCMKYQVVPQTLAVVVGKATLVHQSAGDAPAALAGVNGSYKKGFSISSFLQSGFLSVLEGVLLVLRAAYLAVLFSPVIMTAPLVYLSGTHFREAWLILLHHTLELAGAAFIKWGQWAATRPDLFSRDLCFHLSKLHSEAPSHKFSRTRKIIEGAFERKLGDIFEDFEEEPVASGSIGQVHKAVLRFRHPGQKEKPVVVAVKVRHPGVTEIIRRDFIIISWVARMSTYIPGLSWLRLDESVQQFAVFMLTQVDLAREAAHLSRFIYNFRRSKDVSFPKPLYPLVHPEVLVETFEKGKSVASYLDNPGQTPINKELAHIGINALLKMLLVDNFIHADMHPGNILVRASDSPRRGLFKPRPHVILLDVGMTVELSQHDRQTLLKFFEALATKNGRDAAEYALQFSRSQSCPDPESFKREVERCFAYWSTEEGIKVPIGECIQELLEQVRQHEVNIEGDVCTVMVTTLVLEGWQRKLDPSLNIMDTMQSLLFQSEWASSLSYTIDGLMGP